MTRKSATRNIVDPKTLKAVMPGRLVEASDIHRRMETLHDIILQIDTAQSRDDIIAVIRSEVRWLVEHDICFMSLLNRSATHYAMNSLSPLADASGLNQTYFNVADGIPGWVIKNRTSVIEDLRSSTRPESPIETKLREIGIRSVLAVPMHLDQEVIGSLIVGSKKQGAYTEIDAAVIQLFAHYFGTAIRNAAIFEDVRKRISQIELINEVSQQLAAMLNLEELLAVAAQAIQKTFNYFDVTVFLLSPDRTELLLEAHCGSFLDFLPHGHRHKTNQGITGWVAVHGEKVLCNDVSKDPRYMAYEYHRTNSELTLPIRVDGLVVGVLNVEDTKHHAFDETDSMVLETLSDQLGTAIKNAKLYEEVRDANMKLTELDKMKSEFLGIVSHDFRSPLSSIILAGKALLKHETVQDVKRVKDYLQIIVDQANRLNQLAEDTLSITRIEAGKLTFFFKIVNVARLIEDAMSMVRISKRHEVGYFLDPDVLFIKGDQSKLRQLVQNIVSNAVKYSPRGGTVTISVSNLSEEQILFTISDQGLGIAADKIDQLFQKFSRVDDGEARTIKGSGLGLWICREIVEAHGGKIWIESELDKGTTVRFTLNKSQPSENKSQ